MGIIGFCVVVEGAGFRFTMAGRANFGLLPEGGKMEMSAQL